VAIDKEFRGIANEPGTDSSVKMGEQGMATEPRFDLGKPLVDEIKNLRGQWGYLLALGIVFIVLGTLAILASFIATLTLTITFGILLAVGGFLQAVTSIWTGPWSGRLLHLLLGILYLVAGAFMIRHPLPAAAVITLVLAAAYVAAGLMRIAYAATHRGPGSGWVLLNGLITLVLGIVVWVNWPWDSLWVIGLFVGVDMLFMGWTWVMLATAARSALRAPGPGL
jgi:uncharacterized membrane protein HdeD (DUF308 family)